MIKINEILEQREKTHGRFEDVAETAQHLKTTFRSKEAWHRMSIVQREALDAIAGKIARIINGDETFSDHWHDIAGYAELATQKPIRPIVTSTMVDNVAAALERLEDD